MGKTPDSSQRLHTGPRTRLAWAITSLVLTLTLVGTAWVNRRRTADAVGDIDRSEGEVLLGSIRQALRNLPLPPSRADLEIVLSRHAGEGLKSIEFFGSDHRLAAKAGTRLSQEDIIRGRPIADSPSTTAVAGRIRMLGFFRQTKDSTGVGLAWAPWEATFASGSVPSVIAIEFAPLLERDLVTDANRTFALAALTGAALVAATLMFWRLSEQPELAQQRLEQERRLGVLGEMSAVLAHEIRNPLASLKGNAQLLARRLPRDTIESQKAERVVIEAERLEALTSDLLEFARAGPMDIRPTDPVGLLTSCVNEVAAEGFEIRYNGAPRSWPLDARRVRQALVNVLRNALQASPPGMRPGVTLGQEGDKLVFSVRDYGAGIRPGDEERLFAPFFTTRIAGTGLGLTVARRVAELHRGTIVASNHPGGGALFRIIVAALPPINQRHAQLYPSITLSGSLGTEASSTNALFQGSSVIWNLFSGVTAPLFHGGALRAQKRAAVDAYQASFAVYRQTVLSAFQQVADVLHALDADTPLVDAQYQALNTSQASLELQRLSYAAGKSNLLQLVDAERSYQQARLGYAKVLAQRYQDTVQLFIAMGGGWWQAPDLRPHRS